MSMYESQYAIGQEVWIVRNEAFYRIVSCTACKQTGKIKISDEEFICPKCNGRAGHRQWGGEKYYVWGSSRVGQVCLEHTDATIHYHDNEPNPRYQYMVHSTGVGSGTLWNQEDLFPTEEAAQRYCDSKNGLLPKDECELLEAPADF